MKPLLIETVAERVWRCEICHVEFFGKAALIVHLQIEHKLNQLQLIDCGNHIERLE